MTLLEQLQSKGISVSDCANHLGVATSQIYRWNRLGISLNNPHLNKLGELLGELVEVNESVRPYKRKAPQKLLTLQDTDLTRSPEKPRPTSRPKVVFRKKPIE